MKQSDAASIETIVKDLTDILKDDNGWDSYQLAEYGLSNMDALTDAAQHIDQLAPAEMRELASQYQDQLMLLMQHVPKPVLDMVYDMLRTFGDIGF